MKITESQLRAIIRESINEFRSSSGFDNGTGGDKGYDGDHWYVKPNGETSDAGNSFQLNAGKRGKTNLKYTNWDGDNVRTTTDIANIFTNGKGRLCHELLDKADKILLGNKKIQWTDKEKELIGNIRSDIFQLAKLTKTEGNEKRGYTQAAEEE